MRAVLLLLVLVAACDPNAPDNISHEGAAGSLAVAQEALTTSYTFINSNGGTNPQAQTATNLVRLWVMQFTTSAHGANQKHEWDCPAGWAECWSNFGLPRWSAINCHTDVTPSCTKCDLLKGGQPSGWAAMCRDGAGWYGQYSADGRSANGSGAFELKPKLTVVR